MLHSHRPSRTRHGRGVTLRGPMSWLPANASAGVVPTVIRHVSRAAARSAVHYKAVASL